MKTSWSALRVGCVGVCALAVTLVVQGSAFGQRMSLRVGNPPTNRTLSNYYALVAIPGNPFNPTNQLQQQIGLYYQGQANNQLNQTTGILGNNLGLNQPQNVIVGGGGVGVEI